MRRAGGPSAARGGRPLAESRRFDRAGDLLAATGRSAALRAAPGDRGRPVDSPARAICSLLVSRTRSRCGSGARAWRRPRRACRPRRARPRSAGSRAARAAADDRRPGACRARARAGARRRDARRSARDRPALRCASAPRRRSGSALFASAWRGFTSSRTPSRGTSVIRISSERMRSRSDRDPCGWKRRARSEGRRSAG